MTGDERMIFEFAGQTWDTDKPVFVVGHNSRNWAKVTWHAYRRETYGRPNEETYHEYGVACKKMWIKTIYFGEADGANCVWDIEFALPKSESDRVRFSNSFAANKRKTAVADFLNSLKKKR